MISRRIELGIVTMLAVAIAVNIGLLFFAKARTAHLFSRPFSLARAGIPEPHSLVLEGWSLTGDRPIAVRSNGGKSWAVRYVSNKCAFCETDTHGKRLVTQLEEAGLDVFTLVPRLGEEVVEVAHWPAAPRQISFVSMEWTKRFELSATPTFLLFGPDGRLVWQRRGTLDVGDVAAAMGKLTK
jgi:hypothetical protein